MEIKQKTNIEVMFEVEINKPRRKKLYTRLNQINEEEKV